MAPLLPGDHPENLLSSPANGHLPLLALQPWKLLSVNSWVISKPCSEPPSPNVATRAALQQWLSPRSQLGPCTGRAGPPLAVGWRGRSGLLKAALVFWLPFRGVPRVLGLPPGGVSGSSPVGVTVSVPAQPGDPPALGTQGLGAPSTRGWEACGSRSFV